MKRLLPILLSILTLVPKKSVCQQDPMYSQYMFNGPVINPAYPSMDESPSLTAVARNQWVGINDAPQTASFSFHMPFKSGTSVGLMAYSDKIAIVSENNIALNISQKVSLGNSWFVSLGLRGGVSFYKENNTVLNTNDPVFQLNANYRRMDIGYGLILYNNRFFAGFSSPNFRKLNLSADKSFQLTTQSHYFLQSGYLLDLNEDFKLKPSFLLKYTPDAPWQIDVNASLLIKERVWLGASYRSSQTVVGLVQFQLTQSLQLGYSYDAEFNKYVKASNGGSHELMVNYRFPSARERVVSPRYFY